MECKTHVMAQSDLGLVTVCDCGTVTIHCGNAGMRISKANFATFARMMDEAFASLAVHELKIDLPEDGPSFHPDSNPFCG